MYRLKIAYASLFSNLHSGINISAVFPFTDELYLALVTSSRAHARIVNIDIEDASKVPGFVTWVDHRDIPGENDLGWFGEVFAENKVI